MAEDREHIFDESIRAILDGAEEMPPDRVWAGIESSLGTKKTPAGHVRLFRAAGIVSAAAAVAAVVLLVRPSANEPQQEGLLADNIVAASDGTVDLHSHSGNDEPQSGVAEPLSGIVTAVQDTISLSQGVLTSVSLEDTSAAGTDADSMPSGFVHQSPETADAVASDSVSGSLSDEPVDVVPDDSGRTLYAYAAENATEIAAENITENAADNATNNAAENGSDDAVETSAETSAGHSAKDADVELVENAAADIHAATASAELADIWPETEPGHTSGAHSRRPGRIELTVGGNSFIGSGKETHDVRMMSAGSHRRPTVTSIREQNNPDAYFLPMSFGIGIKFRILKWLDLGVGVNYTLLSKRITGSYFEVDGSGMIFRSFETQFKNSQHYIGVPLDIYFNIYGNEHWNSYASIGTCVEKGLCNHYSGLYEGKTVVLNEKIGGVQTSVKVGLGIEYYPVHFLGIYIDPSLRYYFNNSQPRSIRTVQPLTFGVEAGLRFRL